MRGLPTYSLVNRLIDLVRNGTGRIVIVSSNASVIRAPPEGIMFDNLDCVIIVTSQSASGRSCRARLFVSLN
jgi:hypothetical protein